MNKKFNQIDELFKARLEGAEFSPAASVKAAVVKNVTYLILKNTIFSVLLVVVGATAVVASSYLAFQSHQEEELRVSKDQLAEIKNELNLDSSLEYFSLFELNMIGSPLKERDLGIWNDEFVNLNTNEETKLIFNSPIHSESISDHKRNDFEALQTLNTNSSIRTNSALSSVKSDRLEENTISSAASNITFTSNELLDSSNSLQRDLSESRADYNQQNLEKSFPAMIQNAYSDEGLPATNASLSENPKSQLKLEFMDSNEYLYPESMPYGLAHLNANRKKHRPLAGSFKVGLTFKRSFLTAAANDIPWIADENRVRQTFNNSELTSVGVLGNLEIGRGSIGTGLTFSELKSQYHLIQKEYSYFNTSSTVESYQPITINGEQVLDEEGNPIMELVSSEVLVPDSTRFSKESTRLNEFSYLSIPFTFSYDLVSKRRTSIGLSTEFVYHRLLNAKGAVATLDNSALFEITKHSPDVFVNMASVNVGVLVNYRLTESLNLQLTPGYSFNSNYLRQSTQNSKNYHSGGYMRISLFRSL